MMMKKVLMMCLMAVFGLTVYAQTDRLDSLLNTVMGKEMAIIENQDTSFTYMALYGGANFDSKTYYAGREIGDDMYNIKEYLYFFHSKGYFLGASGSWYSQLDPGYSTTILMAGYSKALNKTKTIYFRTSYSRYIYNQPDPKLDYDFTNSLNTGFTLRHKWIGGRLTTRILFGKDVGIDVMPVIFSRFTLLNINTYDDIQFEPEISFFISSETVQQEHSANTLSNERAEQATTDVYGLLNTQLYLPICISWRDFDLELSYTINLPSTQDQTIHYPASSYFSVSLGYMLLIY